MYDEEYSNQDKNTYYSQKLKRKPLQERINDRYDDLETRFSELSLENDYNDEIKPSKYNGLRIPKESRHREADNSRNHNARVPIYYPQSSRYERSFRKGYSPQQFEKEHFGEFAENKKTKNGFAKNGNDWDDLQPKQFSKAKNQDYIYQHKRRNFLDANSDDSVEIRQLNKNPRQTHNRKFFDSCYGKSPTKNHWIKQNDHESQLKDKPLTPKETSYMLDKLQEELNLLKEKQKDALNYKENTMRIVKNEVSRAKKEFEYAKNKEIEVLIERHKNEMNKKDAELEELRSNNRSTIERYKAACVKRINLEKRENTKKLEAFRSFYEEKLEKYRKAYIKLKEKYKTDIFKKYTNL